MSNNDRFAELSSAIADLDELRIKQIVDDILAGSPSSEDVTAALQAVKRGMDQVGQRYQEGEYFLAEMIFAAAAIQDVMPRLTAALQTEGRPSAGKVILGTVKGDIHDIGKNLVGVILTAGGFDVIDLGTDVDPSRFVAAIQEHEPDIVGMSGLLTLAVDSMKKTVEAITEAGLRDRVKIIIGGNPVTDFVHEKVGSDAWTKSAAEGLEICRRWMEA